MKGVFFGCILLLFFNAAFAQTDGDYRSRQSGDWNDPDSWEIFNGATWETASSTPTSSDGVITLMDGYTITVPSGFSVTVDQIEFENNFGGSTGIITIASGGTMVVDNGVGDDIRLLNDFTTFALVEVYGTLQLNTGATIVDDDYGNLGIGPGPVTPDTYKVRDGGMHIHTTGTGVDAVPFAEWGDGSTCQINATSGAVPSINSSISFHHFTWNGSSQSALLSLTSSLQNVNGDFTVTSTNGQILQLGTTTSYTLSIGGSFFVQANSRVQLASSASPVTINIAENFNISSSNTFTNTVSFNATGTDTKINVTGDFIKSNNSSVSLVAATTGTTELNVSGNFTLLGGTITRNASVSSGSASINFTGTATSAFANSGTILNAINFTISNGRTVDLGTSALTGAGTLTNNGTIRVGATDIGGAIQLGTTGGNIRVSGGRTYVTGSTVIYNGVAAQFMGDGHPASSTGINTTINNSSGVTLVASATITGSLTLTSGDLSLGSNLLTLEGNFTPNSNFLNVTPASSIAINGTSAFGSLAISGGTTINNLTINRTSSGSVTLGTPLSIAGTFTQTAGDLVLNGNTLTLEGTYTRTSGNITVNGTSSLIITGTGTLDDISFNGSELNTLTLDRASGILATGSSLKLNNLNLTSGTFDNSATITMATGGTITRTHLGSMNGTPVAETSYNVVYNISNPISTGVELPTGSSQLNNLTKEGSGTLTLSNGITVNGMLTLTSGTFDVGTNALAIKGNLVSNATSQLTSGDITFSGTTVLSGSTDLTFGDVTITGTGTLTTDADLRINGNLVNNGNLNSGTATVTFGGITAISGSNTCSFNNVVISSGSTLTAPASSINVSGNFTNNGTFNANGGTINFDGTTSISGTATFHNITVSETLNSPSQLNLTGNFIDDGTFNRASGTVRFVGTSTQLIGGTSVTDFNDITVTNTAGPPAVQVITDKNLRGVLTLSGGTKFDPDGTTGNVIFTLMSTSDSPTADAAIATLPAGAEVDGNVTVQRYMAIEGNNNGRIYRYISSPVANALADQILDNIPVSGTFIGANHSGIQSMFYYDETVITDLDGSGVANVNDGYRDFPDASSAEAMENGRGYSLYIRANEAPISTVGSALWDVRGPVNSGEINFNTVTTFTSSGSTADDGWNLVGNPYPATIDWDAASGWTKTGVNDAIYIKDNGKTSPTYATYIGGEGVNGGSRYIATGQAFFVKSDGGPIDFRANENVKVAGTQTSFLRKATPENLLRITLKQGDKRDESLLRFREDGTPGFDGHADAYKLKNAIFNLSSLADTVKLAINSLPLITCGTTVKLDVSDATPGEYSLDFTEFESISEDVTIELFDSFTGSTANVRTDPSYGLEVTADPNSFGDSRFELRFIVREIGEYQLATQDICEGSSAHINVIDSEEGSKYRVMKNGSPLTEWVSGTGDEIDLPIDKDLLAEGENLLTVQAALLNCEAVFKDKATTLNVRGLPEIASVEDALRCGEGELTLKANGTEEGNYHWYETETGDDLIPGATLSTYSPTLSKSKTYFVSAVNELGCEGARTAVTGTIVYPEEIQSVAGGTICQEGSVTLGASGAGSEAEYRWYESEDAVDPIANATSAEFTTPQLTTSKTYFVSISNASGCEGERVPVVAEVLDYEDAVITVEGQTLVSNYTEGNQWLLDGEVITGATGQQLEAEKSGQYTLEVKVGNCTARAAMDLVVTGIENRSNGISVYPNPAEKDVTIEVNSSFGPTRVLLFNSLGTKLWEGNIQSHENGARETSIAMDRFPAGVYLLYVMEGKTVFKTKIVRK